MLFKRGYSGILNMGEEWFYFRKWFFRDWVWDKGYFFLGFCRVEGFSVYLYRGLGRDWDMIWMGYGLGGVMGGFLLVLGF